MARSLAPVVKNQDWLLCMLFNLILACETKFVTRDPLSCTSSGCKANLHCTLAFSLKIVAADTENVFCFFSFIKYTLTDGIY